MADWSSSLSMGSCPECCGGTCPCDTGTMPDTMHGTITYLSGFCTAMGGCNITLTRGFGATWSLSGICTCGPVIGTLSCVDTGGGVYKFRINISFGADLSFAADSTSITCSPVDIEFASVDLIWSGSNGTSLCCIIEPDTSTPSTIGKFKIVITP